MSTWHRRDVLRSLAALGVTAAVPGLAGCARSRSAFSSTLGDDDGVLRVLNWTAYIDTGPDGTAQRFTDRTGFRVEYLEGFDDNVTVYDEILAPALGTGEPTPYDIVCPTFWLAARLVDQGWVEPLPLDLIPNHVNLDVPFLRQPFDRGARFNMPWQSGITGIAYNRDAVDPVASVGELLTRDDLSGRVAFFSEMRDSLGLAMLAGGDDPSAATLDTAVAAIERLTERRDAGHIAAFEDNTGYLDGLASGRYVACVAWSGDLVQLRAERPEFEFLIPGEGGMQWFDTMVVPRRARNGDAIAAWMNFVYDPVNAARITAAVQYISPVVGVRDALADLGGDAAALADDPLLFPDDETRRRLFTWNGTSAAEDDDLNARFRVLVEG